ncbi:MAG: hypothetical protein ABSE97_08630 [Verrucomicrobiota bacterium]|jgi:hypothetical protein
MRIIVALLAGIVWVTATQAQTPARTVESRYLLVFDTSSAMKKRLSATQAAVNRLSFSMMNGQLQPDDSIGVWTFDRKLRAGQFPLQRWLPENAATIASNITTFVKQEHYSKSTRFDAIMPFLDRLVRDSDRLTVLIFCDGNGKIQGTPFDDAINASFTQNQRAFGEMKQTFIIVLRTQFGQYIGYTMNSSATGVNFPEFPPLPQPPAPPPTVKTNPSPPPPPPVVEAPPLVIVGTNVGTNLLPPTKSRPVLTNPPLTNPPPTNPPPPAESLNLTNAALTNTAPLKIAETQTNAPATPTKNPKLSGNGALTIAVMFLAAAGALTVFMLRRSRNTGRGSFITRSMKKD